MAETDDHLYVDLSSMENLERLPRQAHQTIRFPPGPRLPMVAQSTRLTIKEPSAFRAIYTHNTWRFDQWTYRLTVEMVVCSFTSGWF